MAQINAVNVCETRSRKEILFDVQQLNEYNPISLRGRLRGKFQNLDYLK